MPCNCFGKKKDGTNLPSEVPYGKGYTKTVDEHDFISAKNKNTHLSIDGGYQSRESYHHNGSKSNTPSTAPAVASSPNSSMSASPSASPTSYRGAMRRCELAEKRKEFFRDYFIVDEGKCEGGRSTTLPLATSERMNNFEEMYRLRPTSQPSSLVTSPVQPPPPGPHLLRPVSPQTKLKSETFGSPVFLSELRTASDEISRRWQMSDEERDTTPCSLKGKVKVFPVTYVDRSYSTEGVFSTDVPEVTKINEFPDLNFNSEFPDIPITAAVNNICNETAEINDKAESPKIEMYMQPLINIDQESREILINNEENNSMTQCRNVLFDDLIVDAVGIEASSDSALNFPIVGDHRPPSPTIYATSRIDSEPDNIAAEMVDHKVDVPSLGADAPLDLLISVQDNTPLQPEVGQASKVIKPDGEEVNSSFSSDEVPDDVPQQAWHEDEIRPLLEEDDEASPSINITSPNLIDK